MPDAAPGPSSTFLEGVRILDFTTALAGPYCTTILGDLGAAVWKVEPLEGDGMRRRRSERDGQAYPFEMINHDKASLAVDIRQAAGSALVRRMMGLVDVVVENFRPGTLEKYDLDAATARRLYPQLIYASISGYGQTGPMRAEGGVDLVAQGHSGLLSVTGEAASDSPVKAGFPVADVGSGMWAAIGVLGALWRRGAAGVGATVDVALTDSLLAWAVWEVAELQMTGKVPGPLGTAHRLVAPYQAFKCADGRWITVVTPERRWRSFCELVGLPDMAGDPRLGSESSRYEHRVELEARLQPVFLTRSSGAWIDLLRTGGVPCGPVNSVADAMADEQFVAREMWRQVPTARGAATLLNSPIRADGVCGPRKGAAEVGADTRAILRECKLDDVEIDALIDGGVVVAAVSGQ